MHAVPDATDQLTSDHGWNVLSEKRRLIPIQQLNSLKIRTALLLTMILIRLRLQRN